MTSSIEITRNAKAKAENLSNFLFGEVNIVLEDRTDEFYSWWIKRMCNKYNVQI